MTTTELVKKIETLTPQQQAEVADFVEFLATKSSFRSRRGNSARGRYADIPTSSDAFAERKQIEIDRER
ncbi:MAG TPA: DUF2281 domain-containing protein [Armatimonadota bacterium]